MGLLKWQFDCEFVRVRCAFVCIFISLGMCDCACVVCVCVCGAGWAISSLPQGALVVYDVTSRASFETASHWLEELRTHAAPDIVILLVGNKCDRAAVHREVATQAALDFAELKGLAFMETSALDETNVEAAFMDVISLIYERHTRRRLPSAVGVDVAPGTVLVGAPAAAPPPPESGCCGGPPDTPAAASGTAPL
jgi:hypothetical protein